MSFLYVVGYMSAFFFFFFGNNGEPGKGGVT